MVSTCRTVSDKHLRHGGSGYETSAKRTTGVGNYREQKYREQMSRIRDSLYIISGRMTASIILKMTQFIH